MIWGIVMIVVGVLFGVANAFFFCYNVTQWGYWRSRKHAVMIWIALVGMISSIVCITWGIIELLKA